MWQSALTWIEASALGDAIRNAGVWAYGVINLIHIVGIAVLFGSILVLDLCLIGRRRNDLGVVADTVVPLAMLGFAIAALSGVCLLASNGSDYIGNPFLPIKFIAIGLGLCNALLLTQLAAWRKRDAQNARDRVLLSLGGWVSLLCWLTAVCAGRMIGYW